MRCWSRLLAVATAIPGLMGCARDLPSEVEGLARGLLEGQPNIVVVMTDDLDVALVRTMLDLDLAPNIEQYLVAEGTAFARSFVSNSLCCPSRATMLTGQSSHNNGVLGALAREEHGGVDAFDDTSSLATWLQAAGYRTGHIGKYLNGYGSRLDDTTPSFQWEYVPPGWDHWQATLGAGTYRMFRFRINDTADGVQEIVTYWDDVEHYQTTVLTARAVAFVEDAAARGGPFFLEVMPVAPHAESSSEHDTRFDYFIRPDPQDEIDKPDQLALIRSLLPASMSDPSWDFVTPDGPRFVRNRDPFTETDVADITSFYRDRLAAMLAVDDMAGDIVQALADAALLDHSVIVFTSDNGWMWGQHRLMGKRVAFDESTRVPLFIRVPAPAPPSVDAPVVNVDLAPTIVELTQAAAGLPMDGRSLAPLLTSSEPPASWRRRVLLEHWGGLHDVPTYGGFRTDEYLFVDYDEAEFRTVDELYDLAEDPFQVENVHASPQYRSVVRHFEKLLAESRACGGGSCQTLEAE